MADGSVAIALEGVNKRFGAHQAVRDVTIAIGDGEFFSLLGPSGCGKTTTLRMIAGFEAPDEGRIVLQGEDVTSVPANRRPLNMVFQDYALFPHMTVADHVAFGLKLKRVGASETRSRVAEMLTVVRLDGYEDRRPAELSGGQRQRVALARALVNRPAALLLDEPLGALDLKLRREMQLELKRIQQSTGTTFVYVTHDQEEALTMSDRIAVFNDGRIVDVAYAGMITRYLVALDSGGELQVVRQNLETSSAEALEQIGREVVVGWRPEHTVAVQAAVTRGDSDAQ